MSKAVPIHNFPGYYITDSGDVYSRKTYNNRNGRISKLKPIKTKNGYLRVCLWEEGRQSMALIHRLVAGAFIKNPANYQEVNHKNGIKSDNRANNLEWITHQENIKHAYNVLNHGTRKILLCGVWNFL